MLRAAHRVHADWIMVTADTITDDQIRTLRQRTGVETRDARAITSLCDLALGGAETAINEDGEPCDPDENENENEFARIRNNARARCAEIINAINATKGDR